MAQITHSSTVGHMFSVESPLAMEHAEVPRPAAQSVAKPLQM
jgi:hypothetical protein